MEFELNELMETKKMMEVIKDMKVDRLHKRVINEIVEDSQEYSGTPYEKIMARLDDVLHGLSTGVVGSLISYTNTEAFFKRHKKNIYNLLRDEADNAGYTVGEYLATLKDWDSDDYFITGTYNRNILAWWAYETIAYQLQAALEE